MAVNERTFIRISPESTGDRVGFFHTFDIEYTGRTANPIAVGDTVIGATSTTQGTVCNIKSDNNTPTSGVLSIILDAGYESKSFTTGENLQVNSLTTMVASNAGYCIYYNVTNLASADNPFRKQIIDDEGAAFMRFAEGSPQFDAFGRTQMSLEHTIEEYVLRYDLLANDFQDVLVGGGTLTHLPNEAGALLSVGTASGDKVQRTSHHYHLYQAGKSQLIEFTVRSGDVGKANLVRAVGYYDDDNGIFLRLDGTTFEFVQRSKTTGVVEELVIPSTEFNGDRLNGQFGQHNLSGEILDFTKDNIYWIDLQWLGAGRVRFGCFIDGRRITIHSQDNANKFITPYMATASLPLRYEMYNTGITSSSSEMRFYCAAVKTEGEYEPFRRTFGYNTAIATIASEATPVTALAIRPAQTFNGLTNRMALYPSTIEVYNEGTQAVILNVVRNATITGGSWVAKGGESSAELNVTATASGGTIVKSFIIKGGDAKTIDFRSFEENRRGLRRKADPTGYHNQSLQLLCNKTAQTADVRIALNWDELRD